jgi:hypothetical protein
MQSISVDMSSIKNHSQLMDIIGDTIFNLGLDNILKDGVEFRLLNRVRDDPDNFVLFIGSPNKK